MHLIISLKKKVKPDMPDKIKRLEKKRIDSSVGREFLSVGALIANA